MLRKSLVIASIPVMLLACSDDPSGENELPLTTDEAAKYCARAATCLGIEANYCLQRLYSDGNVCSSAICGSISSCLANGSDGCDRFNECWGIRYEMDSCTPTGISCSGTDLVLCNSGGSFFTNVTTDCMRVFGTGCVETESANRPAGCSSGATCSGSDLFCKGSILAQCVSGIEVLLWDCDVLGLSCRDGQCTGREEVCSGPAECEGTDTIAACVKGYRRRMKCSDFGPGFSCVTTTLKGYTSARCQQGTECDPQTTQEPGTCVGSKLELCNAGKKVQVDCKALGFSGCSGGYCTR